MNRHSSKELLPTERTPPSGARESAKRAQILEAAVKVFAEKGFYNSKVSEIAREAGVADGTIYLYFKSKDDVLISLFEQSMAEVNANLEQALASSSDPLAKLRAVIRLHLGLVAQYPYLAEVLTIELRQSTKFMKEYSHHAFGEFLKLLASAIEEGQQAGALRPELDPKVIARALFGALDELALAWLLGVRSPQSHKKHSFELSHAAEQLAELVIGGLRRAPALSHASDESLPTPPQGGGPAGRRTP